MSTRDDIRILPTPLDVAQAVAHVTDPAAGGLAIFLGTTRAEKNSANRDLLALHYEAYDHMALNQLQSLAATARQRWPILKLTLLHRTGDVPVTQPSVLIAVSTPHRADAFDACKFLIDQLKKDVAIWKKEIWDDGTGTWVHEAKK